MSRRFAFVFTLAAAYLAAAAGPVVMPIPNGGFEEGLKGWTLNEPTPMCSVSDEQAASGKYSLKVVDAHPKNGSGAQATRVPITTPGPCELRGKVFPVSGGGLGMYVRVLDKAGKLCMPSDQFQRGLGGKDKKWKPFSLTIYPPKEAAYLELWIHSYSHARVVAYLDDLHFVFLGAGATKPPWTPQYKIRPDEKEKLTAADVVGPDGIVYPNWTQCGVRGGIPDVKPAVHIADFGGKPDDGIDDHDALDKACQAAGEKGGGAVMLAPGTYDLDWPVTIRHSGVVIRGAGMDKTRLIFRYAIPATGATFYNPPAGSRVGPKTRIALHCKPAGLMKMTILMDDVVLRTWERSTHSGNTFATSTSPWRAFKAKLPDGPHKLRGVAEYRDGAKRTCEIDVSLDSKFDDTRVVPDWRAAISFKGRGWAGYRIKLAQDGKRGAMQLELEKAGGLNLGDRILIDGPATKRWKALTRNKCKWGIYRRNAYEIVKVEGKTVHISQPLRIEFPVIDGSYVQRLAVIERGGIEDLYIEQTEDLWITAVQFDMAWNCWARGVKVRKCGRFPVYGRYAKWCTIRDCVFDDAWFKGGGGTAYAGWEHSWDCLMEDVETFKLRHAPLFQWSASGNVIRRGVFHDSDGQWHSGWTNENLMEQCVITSKRGNGGYGFGLWASPPEDTAHGPNGPRNVVYNCDISSQRDGLWMGGMNENWLILYNRFVVEKGKGVFAKTMSFDHIIKGNVFVLKDKRSPMVYLASPDCTGVELVGNKLYGGNGKIAGGWGKPAVAKDNAAHPLADAPRPRPAVPSIYEWQNRER